MSTTLNKLNDEYKMSDDMDSFAWQQLSGRYGNWQLPNTSTMADKVLRIYNAYAPAFLERHSLQTKLIALTDNAIKATAKTIANLALSPQNEPSTAELDYISQQTTQTQRLSDLESLRAKYVSIDTGYIDDFLARFLVCFNTFVETESEAES